MEAPSPSSAVWARASCATLARRAVPALAFGLSVLIAVRAVLALRAAWPFTTDDAYITLRYARHLAEGHGFVFNVSGERVEGYSNFGLVALSALALKLRLEPEFVLKVCGAIGFLGSLLATHRLARRHLGELSSLLPVLAMVEFFGSAWWAVSGLETLIAQCSLTIGLWFLDGLWTETESFAGSPWRGAGFFATSVTLTVLRPEGIVYVGILLVLVLGALILREKSAELTPSAKRRALLTVGSIAAFGFIYHVARWGYFGRLLPNTVLCKMDYDGDPLALHRELWLEFGPVIVLAGIGAIRAPSARVLGLLFPLLASSCLLVGADPIIGYHCRHFLPALPGLALVATLGSREFSRFLLKAPLAACVLSFGLVFGLTPHLNTRELHAEAQNYGRRQALREKLALFIDRELPRDSRVVFGDCGLVPYRSHAEFIDAYCLNSPEMTRAPVLRSPKRFAEYVFANDPAAIIVHSRSPTQLLPQPYLGVWKTIVDDPRFPSRYRLATKFIYDEIACYWVFLRDDVAASRAPVR